MKESLWLSILLTSSISFAQVAPKNAEPPDPKKIENSPPPVTYSIADRQILERGEISTGRYIVGGILGTYPGFGIGHAIQGRYGSKGWIFTVGEVASAAVMVAAFSDGCLSGYGNIRDEGCDDNSGLLIVGIGAFLGFHIWEILDVWIAPPVQNKRYRQLKQAQTSTSSWNAFVTPTSDGGRFVMQLSF